MGGGTDGASHGTDSDGNPALFNVNSNDGERWLDNDNGNADKRWNPNNRFAFLLRNSLRFPPGLPPGGFLCKSCDMKYETILFDFDGTLADSEHVAIEAINAVAPQFGFAPVVPEEIPGLRLLSPWQLLKERAHIPLWNIPKIRRFEKRVRGEMEKRSNTLQLFDGMAQLLRDLRGRGLKVGIVTSSADNIVSAALGRVEVSVDFVDGGSRVFRKARALKRVLRVHGIDSSKTLYIGDELRDIRACKQVGLAMLGVGWGFNAPDALRTAGVEVALTYEELRTKILDA